MNPLAADLARRGRVTFAEFMALALYHPGHGYYTRLREGAGPVGPHGDFITAPSAAPLFARTFASLLERLAEAVGQPLVLVDLGAGEGILLSRVVEFLGDGWRRVLARIVAVETAEWARERVLSTVPGSEVNGRLTDRPLPLGPVVLFASELYDALPAHRVTVVREADTLRFCEFYVEAGEGSSLHWVLERPSSPELERYLAGHGVALEEGQVAELRPHARALHAQHLAWCGENALAVVVDYGYPARRLYNPRGRSGGTLVGYRGHEVVEDVLVDPGEVDITAHVNFDDLLGGALDVGWDAGETRSLGSFLTLHGALRLLPAAAREGAPLTPAEWAELAEAKRILLPGGMASDLRVLCQGRGNLWVAYQQLVTAPPEDA